MRRNPFLLVKLSCAAMIVETSEASVAQAAELVATPGSVTTPDDVRPGLASDKLSA